MKGAPKWLAAEGTVVFFFSFFKEKRGNNSVQSDVSRTLLSSHSRLLLPSRNSKR